MVDDPPAGRGDDFIEQMAHLYGPEAGEQMRQRTARLDAHEHAENAVNEATFWLGAELGGRDIEQDFRTLDTLLRDHPEYFDQD